MLDARAQLPDAEREAFLFQRYQELTSLLPVAKGRRAHNRGA